MAPPRGGAVPVLQGLGPARRGCARPPSCAQRRVSIGGHAGWQPCPPAGRR